jgi:hypothetical protein
MASDIAHYRGKNEPVVENRAADRRRFNMLVLDSVSSPITRRRI